MLENTSDRILGRLTDSSQRDASQTSAPAPAASTWGRHERLYTALASAFVVLLVLTNIVGAKLFVSPLDGASALTTGIITYPLTFLVTDVVSEVYGKRRADFMVMLGFVMSALMLLILFLARTAPPSPHWVAASDPFYPTVAGYQHAYNSVFAVNGLLLFGSMLAYAVAQFTDNFLFHWLKRLTRGKHLWLRNNGSTLVSQLLDTFIVNSILFYVGFGWDFALGVTVMWTIYLHKLLIALLDTPLVYLMVGLIRRFSSELALESAPQPEGA